jgi:hypothetical protein
MKMYDVEVEAVVRKKILVTAESLEEAEEMAHNLFNADADGYPERYNQETKAIRVIYEEDRPERTAWTKGDER